MIYDMMRPNYGPQLQNGMRYRSAYDPGAHDFGGGGREFHPMPQMPMTGGGLPPMQIPQAHAGGPGQMFQVPMMQTGGGLPPMQQPMQGLAGFMARRRAGTRY